MPRSRRRHHSRSRTRSRSHSYERDREPKRRKIESYESPQHKRSISPESNEDNEERVVIIDSDTEIKGKDVLKLQKDGTIGDHEDNKECPIPSRSSDVSKSFQADTSSVSTKDLNASTTDSESDISEIDTTVKSSDPNASQESLNNSVATEGEDQTSKSTVATPGTLKKKLEMEKRRAEKLKEREQKKQEILKMKAEKEKMRKEREQQKLKEKQDKQEQKQKEVEEKLKEKELKEEKKKREREEKEQKRKEKDEQKRKEQEEKDKEKQKQEEKKQKAAAAFVNFFTKKAENSSEEKKCEETLSRCTFFMPFEIKSDMKLAPILRKKLTTDQKAELITALQKQTGKLYLDELKHGKEIGKSDKTWPSEDTDGQDDVMIVEDEVNPGESIEEQPKTNEKMRAKFLKFSDNRRPAYFGTWRKKSKFVKPRKPLAVDKDNFDYEIDSDEDWEEGEDTGESLRGSDDEDKENESDNEYEVDDEFFVPHGHLSDDEVNDEEDAVISPEAHKAKLKLLKKEFEEEMKGKTQKIKPRVIGCIWYNKDFSNVDTAIHEFLKPLSIISNGPIIIKKRSKFILQTPTRKAFQFGKQLGADTVSEYLKFIHGNTNNRKTMVAEFLKELNAKNIFDVSKTSLLKELKRSAEWVRCPEEGPVPNKFCWLVKKELKTDLSPVKSE